MTRGSVQTFAVYPVALETITILEACRICRVEITFIEALVMEGVLEFESDDPSSWIFDPAQLRSLSKAARLHTDLGVNTPGIAVILDLLDALDQARSLPR